MCLFVVDLVDRPEEVATVEEMEDPVNSVTFMPKVYFKVYMAHAFPGN